MLRDPLYVFDKDDGLVRLTPTRLANADQALESLAQQQSLCMPGAFLASHDIVGNGKKVNIVAKRDCTIAWCKIDRLPMRTQYVLMDGSMVPIFATGLNFVNRQFLWLAPMEIRFGVRFSLEFPMQRHQPMWYAKECWLPARHTDGSSWKLPLPNHYSDGRLCLGDSFLSIRGDSIQEAFGKCLDLLGNSNWNNDQIPEVSCSQKMFRFHPETGITMPIVQTDESWMELCRRVNTPPIQEICQ